MACSQTGSTSLWAGTLLEAPKALAVQSGPLLTSFVVSLGGLYLGWLVYRKVAAGEADPLQKPLGAIYTLLKNKYYFDELYNFLFVRPAYWVSDHIYLPVDGPARH